MGPREREREREKEVCRYIYIHIYIYINICLYVYIYMKETAKAPMTPNIAPMVLNADFGLGCLLSRGLQCWKHPTVAFPDIASPVSSNCPSTWRPWSETPASGFFVGDCTHDQRLSISIQNMEVKKNVPSDQGLLWWDSCYACLTKGS